MRHFSASLPRLPRLIALAWATGTLSLALAHPMAYAQSTSSCGLAEATFCETFDQPAGTGNRSGQLNGTLWGVSRATGNINYSGSLSNAWSPSPLRACSGTSNVQPDNDIIICDGQVREATTDGPTGGGSVTTLAMYPKQPFDFADRTGIVTFDVSNDSQGNHSAWPEFWITDQPIPTPFTHEASWIAAPRHGFGIRFAGFADAAGHGATCPGGSPANVGVDSAVTISNYVANDTFNGGNLALRGENCVKASTGPGEMNHYEIHVSQGQIDVYGTDAGTTAPLKHLATIADANLSFTRGLVWIEDVHYNASKLAGNTQGTHTFAWDNVGFDGPTIPRDLTFDVLDELSPAGGGTLNLGWLQAPNTAQTRTIPDVTGIADATAALLTFNFSIASGTTTFTYSVNGHTHTAAWPYPDSATSSWRTLAVPVPLDEVVTGDNSVSIASDRQMIVANVDLILAGSGGGGESSPATPDPGPLGPDADQAD